MGTGSWLDPLKRLLGSPKAAAKGASSGHADVKASGRPPRPPPLKPKPSPRPGVEASPASARAGAKRPPRDKQELERLQQQFCQLQQRLAGLPSHAPEAAREQLLGKLGPSATLEASAGPAGVANNSTSNSGSSKEHGRLPLRHSALRRHGKAGTLSKLTKLARQRQCRGPEEAGSGAAGSAQEAEASHEQEPAAEVAQQGPAAGQLLERKSSSLTPRQLASRATERCECGRLAWRWVQEHCLRTTWNSADRPAH